MADTTETLKKKANKYQAELLKLENTRAEARSARDTAADLYKHASNFVDKEFFGDAEPIAQKCQKYFGKRIMSLNEAKKAVEKLKEDAQKKQTAYVSAQNKETEHRKQYLAICKTLDDYVTGKLQLKKDDPNYGKDKKALKKSLGL